MRVAASSAAAVTATVLVGCGEKTEASASSAVSESPASGSSSADKPTKVGWSLEECQELGGLYYKTDDDRFITYNGADCVKDIGDEANTVLASLAVYDRAIETPVHTLYFFMWPEYKSDNFHIMTYKIVASGWMPMIVFPGDDKQRLVTSLYVSESQKEIEFFSRYGMTNFKNLWVKTIDGEQAYTSKDIVTIKDKGSVEPIKTFSDDMKGQKVTFGYAEGTMLTEQECYINEFFGIYGNLMEYVVDPTITPTTDGYAILDYSGIQEKEEGLYVLNIGVSEGNNKTVKNYCTLLNLKR